MPDNKKQKARSASLRIDTRRTGAVINKNVYGQFAEHLGRCIYDGLWVGPNSEIPNTRGWRKDVVAALKDIQVPVVRWPGGCFADTYHWRDGIGPQEQRPVTVNTLWGGVEESNAVGTHEFYDLIEQLGAEAYINGNIGTGTAQEMADWLEYLTSDTKSGLAELRRQNGRDEPFPVPFFGVGNECWGCGGHMEPEYYTSLYKHWGTFLRTPWDARPKFVASGGHGEGDKDVTRWTDYLTANIEPDFLLGFDAVSFHYYTHPKGDVFTPKGPTIGFQEEEWASTLAHTLKMDSYIIANKAVMDKNDPENTISFYIDEWGTWYDTDDDNNPGFLYQQNTLRDAVVAALNFNIFHKHADRVGMTNIAQVANVLQSMVLTEDDKLLLTPTYHVFKMYTPFQDATSLTFELESAETYQFGEHSIPAISASAAIGKDGKVYLALVNADPDEEKTVAIALEGIDASSAEGHVLTADAMDTHNTFTQPNVIEPAAYTAKVEEGELTLVLPAKSVVVVAVV